MRRESDATTQHQIARYLAKISGPLLDRIDLHVEVAALTTDEITSTEAAESSASIQSVRQGVFSMRRSATHAFDNLSAT